MASRSVWQVNHLDLVFRQPQKTGVLELQRLRNETAASIVATQQSWLQVR